MKDNTIFLIPKILDRTINQKSKEAASIYRTPYNTDRHDTVPYKTRFEKCTK